MVTYSGCRLNVARLGGTSNATLSPVLHWGSGSPEDVALRDLARLATIGHVHMLHQPTSTVDLCSPFYGRACRWAMLGELKP